MKKLKIVLLLVILVLVMTEIENIRYEVGLRSGTATFEKGVAQADGLINPTMFDQLRTGAQVWDTIIDFEDGDIAEFDSTVDTASKLASNIPSAHDGIYGMEVTLNNTTVGYGVTAVQGSLIGNYSSEWINLNDTSVTDSSQSKFLGMFQPSADANARAWVYLSVVSGDFKIGGGHRTDGGSMVDDGSVTVGAGWHHVQLWFNPGTIGDDNGIVSLIVDGVFVFNTTNIDNDTLLVNQIHTGFVDTDAASVSGSYYIDTIYGEGVGALPYPSTIAALSGDYGMLFHVSSGGTAGQPYGDLDGPTSETIFETSFLFDPNSLTMATNDKFIINQARTTGGTVVYTLEAGYDGADYFIVASVITTDTGSTFTSDYVIPDQPIQIGVEWRASTGAGDDNGSFVLLRDGVILETVADLDNDTLVIDTIRTGLVGQLDSGTSGSFYIDNIVWTGFVDITADVSASPSPKMTYGIRGNSPKKRVASPGAATFALNNSASNSAGLLGLYSPDHANALTGFDFGIPVRIILTDPADSQDRYKFRGTIETANPVPGQNRARKSLIMVTDFIKEMSDGKISGVEVIENTNDVEIIERAMASLSNAPVSKEFGTPIDTYPIAFHDVRDESTKVLNVVNRAIMSGFGWFYRVGDTATGEKLLYQTRSDRLTSLVSKFTLDNTMTDLGVRRTKKDIVNKIFVRIHPAKIDAAATTVLYSLQQDIELAPGQSREIRCPFGDPSTEIPTRVGGKDIVNPLVADTHYKMSSVAGDGGNDLNANLDAKIDSNLDVISGNNVIVMIKNTGGTIGFVNKIDIIGKGIYIPNPIDVIGEDVDSGTAHGDSEMSYNAVYQTDLNVGTLITENILQFYKDPFSNAMTVDFFANRNAAAMTAALEIEPGDVITLSETVTGLADLDVFVNGVQITIMPGKIIKVRWWIAPLVTLGSLLLETGDLFLLEDGGELLLES